MFCLLPVRTIALDKGEMGLHHLAMAPKDPRIPPKSSIRKIDVLAFPDVQLLDVAGPLQVFASANERAVEQGLARSYVVTVVAPEDQITATAGLSFAAAPLPPSEAPVDTVIIAGGQGVMRAAADTELVGWVRERAGVARRVASVCTGAFLLGAAGLLNGRRAVTHWEYCDRLARRHPLVTVDPDPIFIHDGPIWTSAGVTAGIDLALALVEEDLGRQIALAVARHLVVFLKRPGGQAQFSTALTLQSSDDRFASLHEWLAGNLDDDLSLHRLAAQAGMSERSFLRRYRAATGMTPGRAIERLRVETARQLLSETTMPLKRIAQRCGFGTEETMRRSFLRVQGTGPSDYRTRFSAA
jgi:transcriptional regulator GlxA family with amidase domain